MFACVYMCKLADYTDLTRGKIFEKKGVTSTLSSTVMRIGAVNMKLSTFQV